MDGEELRELARKNLQALNAVIAERAMDLGRLLQSHGAEVIRESIRQSARDWGPLLTKALDHVHEAVEHGLPPNWSTLTVPELFEAASLMEETGWSLCWTPPPHIVQGLLRCNDQTRREQLLLASEAVIVSDLGTLIAASDHSGVSTLKRAAREALETYSAGYFRASQALSAAALGIVVHEHLNHRLWKHAREAFERLDPEEEGIRTYRFNCLQRALLPATAWYSPGNPPPPTFNRHASVHGVSDVQFNQLNSLSAIMLVVSFLREISSILWVVDELAEEGAEARDV